MKCIECDCCKLVLPDKYICIGVKEPFMIEDVNAVCTEYAHYMEIEKEGILAFNFTNQPLYVDDVVVYLKNERTGSSTIRKCKFIGQIVGAKGKKIKIARLSKADQFVTPDECINYGEDIIFPDDVVHIIISKNV